MQQANENIVIVSAATQAEATPAIDKFVISPAEIKNMRFVNDIKNDGYIMKKHGIIIDKIDSIVVDKEKAVGGLNEMFKLSGIPKHIYEEKHYTLDDYFNDFHPEVKNIFTAYCMKHRKCVEEVISKHKHLGQLVNEADKYNSDKMKRAKYDVVEHSLYRQGYPEYEKVLINILFKIPKEYNSIASIYDASYFVKELEKCFIRWKVPDYRRPLEKYNQWENSEIIGLICLKMFAKDMSTYRDIGRDVFGDPEDLEINFAGMHCQYERGVISGSLGQIISTLKEIGEQRSFFYPVSWFDYCVDDFIEIRNLLSYEKDSEEKIELLKKDFNIGLTAQAIEKKVVNFYYQQLALIKSMMSSQNLGVYNLDGHFDKSNSPTAIMSCIIDHFDNFLKELKEKDLEEFKESEEAYDKFSKCINQCFKYIQTYRDMIQENFDILKKFIEMHGELEAFAKEYNDKIRFAIKQFENFDPEKLLNSWQTFEATYKMVNGVLSSDIGCSQVKEHFKEYKENGIIDAIKEFLCKELKEKYSFIYSE